VAAGPADRVDRLGFGFAVAQCSALARGSRAPRNIQAAGWGRASRGPEGQRGPAVGVPAQVLSVQALQVQAREAQPALARASREPRRAWVRQVRRHLCVRRPEERW